MTIENTERVMHAYHDAWERGDQEAGMSFYADDLVVYMGGNGPLAGVYNSREDFNTNWIGRVGQYTDTWDVVGNDTLLVGADGVLLLVRERWARGDRSVTTERLGFYRVSGDKIVECRFADMNQPDVEAFFGDLTGND
ncbi:nuclear transport factor 2 family protein [Mycolicibacterium sp. P9-64]|uniref:nuclear transport factor 2 family protein n=1 Tax=Mycolicibacterium sp. P9-64 TaxID=2024612 RepID=UPI0011EE1005|nr:nuclear transport factor 2 family protein [Mycolicibacterium sp. P9-64]KAA0084539.1 nuclear transport factor 2 family protein [Mycolicibacterium sp. P9-64]